MIIMAATEHLFTSLRHLESEVVASPWRWQRTFTSCCRHTKRWKGKSTMQMKQPSVLSRNLLLELLFWCTTVMNMNLQSSKKGFDALLMQDGHPVAYAGCAITKTETWYARPCSLFFLKSDWAVFTADCFFISFAKSSMLSPQRLTFE